MQSYNSHSTSEGKTYRRVHEPSSLPFSLLPVPIDDKFSNLFAHLPNNLLFLFRPFLTPNEFVLRDAPFR